MDDKTMQSNRFIVTRSQHVDTTHVSRSPSVNIKRIQNLARQKKNYFRFFSCMIKGLWVTLQHLFSPKQNVIIIRVSAINVILNHFCFRYDTQIPFNAL